MNQDFSELIEYLDEKFEKTASKEDVENLQTEVKGDIQNFRTEVDGKFTKAFDVFATKDDVKEIKGTLSELQETVHELVGAVDKLAKAVDDLRIEYSAMAMQLNRHEKWIQQLAEKLGIKLDY